MVQVINIKRRPTLTQTLGNELFNGLEKFSNAYFANKQLDKIESDPEYAKLPLSEKYSRLSRGLTPFGETGERVLENRSKVLQQQHQENKEVRIQEEQNVLADIYSGNKISPEQRAKLSPETQLKVENIETQRAKIEGQKKIAGNIKTALIKAGYPEETAQLWQDQYEAAPTGGKTDVIRHVNDFLKRSKTGKGLEQEEKTTSSTIDIPGMETTKLEMNFPEIPESIGLTPSDMVKQQEAREKVISPLYAETIDTLNALDEDYRDLLHLKDLNQSENLPVGIQKWNVNWETGDLRFPALATPEAQSYVKTIARMLGHAKDFFPGRVTNFDLESFRRRFPTLANSPEGRTLLAKELELANRIAYLREETLKSAIEHYGSGADPIMIRKAANENYRRLKGTLENQLKSLNKQSDVYSQQNAEPNSESSGDQRMPLEDIFK